MHVFILLIALLEGFTTLAIQMIALRVAAPIVGSSVIVTSVYIGIILLALSGGYYVGGKVASIHKKHNLAGILAIFLFISAIYYGAITFGMHQYLLNFFLHFTQNYLVTLFLTAILLFFIPVFIAAQTIPLLTEINTIHSKGMAAGSMLFWSTIGSFLGSVGTTILLFPRIGIIRTSVLSVIILLLASLLSFLLYSTKYRIAQIVLFLVLSAGITYWGYTAHPRDVFRFDSAYQQIIIDEFTLQGDKIRLFLTDGAFASGIFTHTKESPFGYIREAVTITEKLQPNNVLVLGTAGFTYPYEIVTKGFAQHVDAIDIDPDVYRIAQEHFLETQLPDTIVFYPQSARYFVRGAIQEGKGYDLIFVDAFNGKQIPDELITQEFFQAIQSITNPGGTILFNMILDKELETTLAQNILTTLNTVFPTIYTKNVGTNPDSHVNNFILSTKALTDYTPTFREGEVYTDNKRTSESDILSFLQREVMR